jgi:4-carboxymuconolactone decarboxylase
MDDKSRHEEGMRIRRFVLGDAHVDNSVAATTDITAAWQDYITRNAWGDVWNRPGLDMRTRSAITISLLVALGAEHELGLHIQGGIRNGLTKAEIFEIIQHSSIYVGLPKANNAIAVAKKEVD